MSLTLLPDRNDADTGLVLRTALQAAGQCVFELDPRTQRLVWPVSGNADRLLGHLLRSLIEIPDLLALVHPADRAAFQAELLDARWDVDASRPAAVFRLRGEAGDYGWVALRSTRMIASGRTLQVGTLREVRAERQREDHPALSARLLEAIRDPVAITDPQGKLVWTNAACAGLLGVPRERLAGRNLAGFWALNDAHRVEQFQDIRDALERRGAWQGRLDLRAADGSTRAVEASISGLGGEALDNQPLQGESIQSESIQSGDGHWVYLLRDISERVAMEAATLATARDEQQRVGLELHDQIGQQLAGTSMLVRTLRNAARDGAAADPLLLQDVETLLLNSVSRCRDLAQIVAPYLIDEHGLDAAVQDLAVRTRQAAPQAHVRVEVCAQTAGFAGDFGEHLFRLAQLLLAGVLARDAVSSVDLQLWCEADDRIALAIVADGRAAAGASEQSGERLLRHRLALVGGRSETMTAAGGRWGSIVLVPVPTAALRAEDRADAPALTALRAG